MKVLIIICYLQIAVSYCSAQTDVALLAGTKWMDESKGVIRYLEFEKDSLIETMHNSYNNKKISFSKPYYLSDTHEGSFDMNMVGGESAGKYLLRWNKKLCGMEYCEIKAVSEDSLVLFFEAKPNHVGSVNNYVTYKRIK